MPIHAGLIGSFPPPATGAAMCTTSISISITSRSRISRFHLRWMAAQEWTIHMYIRHSVKPWQTAWSMQTITMSNPGSFRIEIDAVKRGGISDSRNGTMLKMFNLIDIGEHTGSGIPNIFRVWRQQGWIMPVITEQLEQKRTLLTLTSEKIGDKKLPISARMRRLSWPI